MLEEVVGLDLRAGVQSQKLERLQDWLQGEVNTAKQAAQLQLRIGVTRLSEHCANSTQKTQ